MNRDRIEGHWTQMKGRARKASGRWSDSEREVAERPHLPARAPRAWDAREEDSRRVNRDLPSR